MSWQVVPLKVEWPKFLCTFPRPARWTRACKARLSRNDSRQQEAWVACFVAMRRHLPQETVLSVEWLVRATTLDTLPRWKGLKPPVWYKPHFTFDPEDYPGPGSGGPLLPLMSPGNVVDVLHFLRLRDPDQVAEDLRAAWVRLSGMEAREECARLGFGDVDVFVTHLREWQSIMTEIESDKAGFAIDLA